MSDLETDYYDLSDDAKSVPEIDYYTELGRLLSVVITTDKAAQKAKDDLEKFIKENINDKSVQ